MSKRKTNEEFIKDLSMLQSGIIALDPYINAVTKIRFQCKSGHVWSAKPSNILSGFGCPYCAGRHKTKEALQHELDLIGNEITVVGEYVNSKTEIEFSCKNGHTWCAVPTSVLGGRGCPYCANKKVLPGFNDLWTTHPHIAKLLQNPEDGYKYTYGSGKKVTFICPDCGSTSVKDIHVVCQNGLACHMCSDGISYPNKFSRALLSLLPVNNVQHEWQPDWVKPYSYDNYFEYNGCKYILEMDGALGHGKRSMSSNRNDIVGLRNDNLKDLLAHEHNINVIRIDCDYPTDNRFEYIKHSVQSSELGQLFNLSNIDWTWCNEQGVRKMVKEVANMYADGLAVKTICKQIGHSSSTVARWLRQARSIGLCDYNEHESRIRARGSANANSIPANRYTMDGHYVATYSSMSEASRILKISESHISACCNNSKCDVHGYRWYKACDINQPNKTKVMTI